MSNRIVSECFSNRNSGGTANVVDGLFAIARSLDGVARAIRDLGNADASTPMGAIEALGLVMKDGLAEIATAIENHHGGIRMTAIGRGEGKIPQ